MASTGAGRRTVGVPRLALASLLVALTSLGAAALPANAATGDVLREITADQPSSCRPDTGVAFDGRELFVTCAFSSVIDVVRTSDGSLVRRITVPGVRGLSAASYDRLRDRLLVCGDGFSGNSNDFFVARLVDRVTGASVRAFFTQGCPFGLSADASDDTVYASRNQSCTVNHYRPDGVLLSAHDICALGAPDPSGLAVGTTQLFVGSFSGGVYAVSKDFSSALLLFPTNFSVSALACDDVTFAPRTALWAGTGTDRVLRAVEIPRGSCTVGGGPPRPTTKEQCKKGGWRNFGSTFRNQGDCVSFVATGGRNAPHS